MSKKGKKKLEFVEQKKKPNPIKEEEAEENDFQEWSKKGKQKLEIGKKKLKPMKEVEAKENDFQESEIQNLALPVINPKKKSINSAIKSFKINQLRNINDENNSVEEESLYKLEQPLENASTFREKSRLVQNVSKMFSKPKQPAPIKNDLKMITSTQLESEGLLIKDFKNLEQRKLLNMLPKTRNVEFFLDLSGYVVLTDYDIYELSGIIKNNAELKDLIKLDLTKLNGCKYISIWSLFYLNKSIGNCSFDLDNLNSAKTSIKDRVSGCDRISEHMIYSLEHSRANHNALKMADTSKIVIINENECEPILTHYLRTDFKETMSKLKFFDYAKISYSDKIFNIYECTDSMCDVFLSERNLVVITFKTESKLDKTKESIMDRLLKIANKNILPISIMVLGIGYLDRESFIKEISQSIFENIKELQNELNKSFNQANQESQLTNTSWSKLIISNQLNLIEQLEHFKAIINFSTIDLNQKEAKLLHQINQTPNEEKEKIKLQKIEEIETLQKKAVKSLNNIKAQDLTELKRFTKPPAVVQPVGAAMNLLIGVSDTSWPAFTKEIKESNVFLDKLHSYDYNIPDDIMTKLKEYLDLPDMRRDNKRVKEAYFPQDLFNWIHFTYEIGLMKQELKNLNYGPGSQFDTILEYFHLNSFYLFCWPIYVQSSLNAETIKNSNEAVVKGSDLKKIKDEKFMKVSECLYKYNHFISSDFYSNTDKYFKSNTDEKMIMSESARGNVLMNNDMRFMITDLTWFAKIISLLSDSKTKSGDFKELCCSMGESVPVWDYELFKAEACKDLTLWLFPSIP